MPHILWAEDSEVDRMFIQAVMRQLPEQPTTEFADDGDALLKGLETSKPDLLVLDLMMPGASGLEVLSILQAKGSTIPVAVFSGAEGAATIAACYKLGATRFIQK